MKKLIVICVVVVLYTANVFAADVFVSSETKSAAKVEVIYFHGKQRCMTCLAIEKETKTLVEGELAAMVRKGKVRMRVVDFSTTNGKEIARRYKVSFSSLLIVTNYGKSETVEDLTRFAFANARSNAEGFRKGLKEKVMELIK